MTMQPVIAFAPAPQVFLQTQTLVQGTAVPQQASCVYEHAMGESHPLSVNVAGLPLRADGSPARFAGLWVRVVWTRNGATFSMIHPANKRINVSASRIEITPFIRPILTQTDALPADVRASVLCTVMNGHDGALIPSLWIPSTDPLGNPLGFRGQIAPYPSLTYRLNGLGPLLLLRAQGYNAGADGRYIMFFDIEEDPSSAAAAGTLKPLLSAYVQPNGGTFSTDQASSGYAVHQGLWWGVSSTADFFTADPAALFRVDAEIEAYEVQRAAVAAGG